MNWNFSKGRIYLFFGILAVILSVFQWWTGPLYLVPVMAACLFVLVFSESDEDRVKRAKADADIALHQQQARLAGKDAPIAVASQIAVIQAETDAKIKLVEAEASIKLWAEKGNAEKVLEFTKKKVLLEEELKNIRG